MTRTELKQSLLNLIKYQLVDYTRNVKSYRHQYDYKIIFPRIFFFFRIPKMISETSLKDAPFAASILQTVAEGGLIDANVVRAKLKAEFAPKYNEPEELEARLNAELSKLINDRYIDQINNNFSINIENCSRFYRDNLIVKALTNYYGNANVGHLCRAILDLSLHNTDHLALITAPVTMTDLCKSLIPGQFHSRELLERHLGKLTSEQNNRFLISCGSHPTKGDMFAINIGLVIDYLVKEHLSTLITAKFGPKCCRVFRVLMSRGPLLPEQIEGIIMLPSRDVREYCYMMMKEGFVRIRQIPKTPDCAPAKSVYLVLVELEQVIFMVADSCCKSIANLLRRHEYESNKHKALLDRSKAVLEMLGSSTNSEHNEEWLQYFNSHELSELDRINTRLDKLLLAKSQSDETLHLLHTYMSSNNHV